MLTHTRRTITLILLIAVLLLAGCSSQEPPPSLVDPTGFFSYVHPTEAFSLSMPQDWVVGDTSDPYALNVSFSPPDYALPLVNVYLVSADALAEPGAEPPARFVNESPVTTPFDDLISHYQAAFYAFHDATYKEIDRTLMPDGSVRIRYVIDSPDGTTQHNDFLQVQGDYFVALRITLPNDLALLRTIDRITNTLSVNPGSGWASQSRNTPGDVAPGDLIGFTNLNAWAGRGGGFVIVGQVTNNAAQPLEFVRVNAQLYDTNNRLLLEQDDFVSSDLINPGELAPFSIVFSDGLPPDSSRYVLEVSGRYAGITAQTFYGPENFALTSDARFDEDGALEVAGRIRNEGNLEANLVKVIVTVFDAQQRVIATDTTLVENQQLAPGETSDFSVRFFELGGDPNNFLVTAQGLITE